MNSEKSASVSLSDTLDENDPGGKSELLSCQDSEMIAALPMKEGQPNTDVVEDSRFSSISVTRERPTRTKSKKTVRMTASPTASEAFYYQSPKVEAKKAIVESTEDDDLQEIVEEALACIERAVPGSSGLAQNWGDLVEPVFWNLTGLCFVGAFGTEFAEFEPSNQRIRTSKLRGSCWHFSWAMSHYSVAYFNGSIVLPPDIFPCTGVPG
eukprot:IDg6281t1